MKKNEVSKLGLDLDNEVVELERTKDFTDTARAVGDYLKGLPLTTEQNDTLVELMVQHTKAAEKSGFTAGLGMGMKIAKGV